MKTGVVVAGFVVAIAVAYVAFRYLCFLFARGDAKNVPGGGVYWRKYGQEPKG